MLRCPSRNPERIPPELAAMYNSLPLPSSSQLLVQPDQRFLDSESFTNKFAAHLSSSTERVNRRLMKRWSELETDWLDLGAILNGFSLGEQPGLAEGIEKTGQAVDASYTHTNAMVRMSSYCDRFVLTICVLLASRLGTVFHRASFRIWTVQRDHQTTAQISPQQACSIRNCPRM
jgi:hypothetical protein